MKKKRNSEQRLYLLVSIKLFSSTENLFPAFKSKFLRFHHERPGSVLQGSVSAQSKMIFIMMHSLHSEKLGNWKDVALNSVKFDVLQKTSLLFVPTRAFL